MNKKLVSIIFTVILALLLLGCSPETTNNASNEGKGNTETKSNGKKAYKVACVVKDMSDPWFIRYKEGVDQLAKDTGIECYVKGPSKTDSAEQIQVIETLIEQDINALCVVPIDPEACKTVLKKAKDKGIVIITHEAEGNEVCDYDLEAFNNEEYGAKMMDKLAEAMGKKGSYVTMVAFLSSTSHNQWMDAAVARQKEAYPDMSLIPEARIECEDNMDMAYNKAKEIIKKYPDIKGFIGASSYDPPGAAKAIDELGMTGKIFSVGTGVPSVSGPYLKSGSNPAVLCCDPALSAQAQVKLAVLCLDGKQNEIKTGMTLEGITGYDNLNVNGKNIYGHAVLVIDEKNMGDYGF